MTRHSEEWSRYIQGLREKYGFTYRDMERETGVIASTVNGWIVDHKIPPAEKALKFFSAEVWTPEERFEGMKLTGYPIPDEWKPKEDPIQALDRILEGLQNAGKIPSEGREQILDFVVRTLKKAHENHDTRM